MRIVKPAGIIGPAPAWRSRTYLDWVKCQACIVSLQPADDPHHILGHGFSGSGKAPDWATIPLTRAVHDDLHRKGYQAWERQYGSQMDLLARFWMLNFDEIRHFFTP